MRVLRELSEVVWSCTEKALTGELWCEESMEFGRIWNKTERMPKDDMGEH